MSCEGRRHRPNVHLGHLQRSRRMVDSCEKVPVKPFAERFERLRSIGEMNTRQLCILMGWVYRPSEQGARAERRRPGCVKAETSRALETLGLRRTHRYPYGKEFVTYDVALRLADALGMDPHEAGI